jgi:hypothetical protein
MEEQQELLTRLETNQKIYNQRAEEAQSLGDSKYLIETLLLSKTTKDDIQTTRLNIQAYQVRTETELSIAVPKKLQRLRQVNFI